MPRFFLNQRGGAHEFVDDEGADFADVGEARSHAIAGLRAILAEELLHGRLPLDERIDVNDAAGRLLLRIAFVDCIGASDAASFAPHRWGDA